MQITLDDLIAAYKRTRLKKAGITFLTAFDDPMLNRCLTRAAECYLAKLEKSGKPAPRQPELFSRGSQ